MPQDSGREKRGGEVMYHIAGHCQQQRTLTTIAYLPSHLTQILAQPSRSFTTSHAMQHSLSLAFSHIFSAKVDGIPKIRHWTQTKYPWAPQLLQCCFLSFFLGAAPWLVALYIS